MRNIYSFLNVYEKRTTKSKVVTQLLYGETFKLVNKNKKWIEIKNDLDNYKGFIKLRKFFKNQKNTHKVCNLSCKLYSKPNLNYKIKKKLSFGSRVKVIKKKNNFYKVDNFWIKNGDLEKDNYKTKDVFKNIKKFINVKYKWGGKHFSGIDCSALVQIFLNFNNKYCPRDSADQQKYFKKNTTLKKIRKNDLIFWKGHVAVIISKTHLIHAYGPLKKVVIMPIKSTIDRIFKTANLKVTGIRRII